MPIPPEPAKRTGIVLVNMPFCPVERPSLALGLLKSILAADGLPSTILYPNMWFLEYVGVADYSIFEHSPNEDALVDWVVDRILQEAPAIVGCTSTFQQHVASLAVLRRLRERAPQIVTLMGGAN